MIIFQHHLNRNTKLKLSLYVSPKRYYPDINNEVKRSLIIVRCMLSSSKFSYLLMYFYCFLQTIWKHVTD